jgi:anthranilate synthase/aminodeoxychorismate synthase-like glutamine amidotransferase
MRILLIDNFDSFTHNLAQLFGMAGAEVIVRRNTTSLDTLKAFHPDALLISPGPGRPRDAGVSNDALGHWADKLPVLGVCLGMQVINEFFGGSTVHAPRPVHGMTSALRHDGSGIFSGLPSPFPVARYHSLAVRRNDDCLTEQAWAPDGVLMALRHSELPIHAVQFHPESFMTMYGLDMARNFLALLPGGKGYA